MVINKKMKQFMTIKSVLQRILKRMLHTEKEDKCNHENMRMNKSRQGDKQMKSKSKSKTKNSRGW
jgi:hypothetical protein